MYLQQFFIIPGDISAATDPPPPRVYLHNSFLERGDSILGTERSRPENSRDAIRFYFTAGSARHKHWNRDKGSSSAAILGSEKGSIHLPLSRQ